MTKLAATLPKAPDGDGLTVLHKAFLAKPDLVHLMIVELEVCKHTTNFDTGEVEPTVRIRSIEAVTEADQGNARILQERAVQRRTGQATFALLDAELNNFANQVMDAAALVDVETGEVVE